MELELLMATGLTAEPSARNALLLRGAKNDSRPLLNNDGTSDPGAGEGAGEGVGDGDADGSSADMLAAAAPPPCGGLVV